MKKFSLLVALVMICSMVLGTNTQKASSDTDCDWPMFGRTPEGNRVAPDGCGPKTDNLDLLWGQSYIVDPTNKDSYAVLHNPVAYKNNLYFSTFNTITCVDSNTKKMIWSKQLEVGYICGGVQDPVISNDMIFISAGGNKLYCLSAFGGDEIWTFDAKLPVWSNLTVTNNNTIIIITGGSQFGNPKAFCLLKKNGEKIWEKDIIETSFIYSCLLSDNLLYVQTDWQLFCLNAKNGDLNWALNDIDKSTSPVICNSKLYVRYIDDLTCLDAKTGDIEWTKKIFDDRYDPYRSVFLYKLSDSIIVNSLIKDKDDNVYTNLMCVYSDSIVWQKRYINSEKRFLACTESKIYLGNNNDLCIISTSNGTEIKSFRLEMPIISDVIVAYGNLYYTSAIRVVNGSSSSVRDGSLICIGDVKSLTKNVNIRLTINSKVAYINGQQSTLQAPPQIFKGSTVVPLRFIGDAFGCNVEWESATKKITLTGKNLKIELWIGNTNALVNGESKTLTVAPTVIKGTTMVPLRFISEAFGAQVNYDAKTKVIDIQWQPQD